VANSAPLASASVFFSSPPYAPDTCYAEAGSSAAQNAGSSASESAETPGHAVRREASEREPVASTAAAMDAVDTSGDDTSGDDTDALWSSQATSPPDGPQKTAILHTEDAGAGLLDDLNQLMDQGWRFVRMDVTSGQIIRIHLGQQG
jgi:hypothetical protein